MAALSEEQQMIKDQASAWVREQAPVSTFRAMRDQGLAQGFFSETWQAMIEMGWTGLVVPETYGGAGLGFSHSYTLQAHLLWLKAILNVKWPNPRCFCTIIHHRW